ncbi:hypothetical protein QZH41_015066, partial [Actinostola sp. cb2023]
VPVGKREGATKIQARGLFGGARVERGPDWRWGEQDGGKGGQGTVVALQDWKTKGRKCGVSVRWDHTKRDNVYRNGFEGKVDLIVVTAESGGFFYKDHLPGLVARSKKVVSGFTTGDKVQISVTKEELVKMAEGHGGWNSSMEECIPKIGKVHDFTKSGDVIVNYDGVKWRLTPTAITMVQRFNIGDKVLVSSDKKFVVEMQQGHGGWNENMKTMLGMIGTVKSIHQEEEDVVLKVENNIWLVNPAILTLHEASKEESNESDDDTDLVDHFFKQQFTLQKMLSELLMGNDGDSKTDEKESMEGSALVQAVSHGHMSRVKQILKSHPELVNHVTLGKTSLHLACHNGFCDIIKLLLETPNCDTSIKDSQGYLAIHHAAYGDKSGEAIELMLAHGDDPNTADNANKCTPLHLAVKETNLNAVRVLVLSQTSDVNLQDSGGDTPLHDAIQMRNNAIVDLILDASRLNLTLVNAQGFNCLHLSAFKGNPHAARKLLSKSPELLNIAKDDGFTALHLAAVNDHCEIAEILLEHVSLVVFVKPHHHPDCQVNCVSKNYQTPLMLAVHEGYLTMVQTLEQKGADVNATDEDGDTPLHMSLVREKFFATGMGKVLSLLGNNNPGSFTEISRYLISHGSNVRHVNNIGKTPMDFGVGTQAEGDLKKAYENTRSETKEEKTLKIVNQFGNIKVRHAHIILTGTDSKKSVSRNIRGTGKHVENIPLKQSPQTDTTEVGQKEDNKVDVSLKGNDDEEFQNGQANSHQILPTRDWDEPKDSASCLICVDGEADTVFLPCGHRILCTECSTRAKRCPECKQQVVSKKTKEGREVSMGDDKEQTTMEDQLQAVEKKLRKLEESVTCCVCLSRRMNMVFPCGHGACQVCTEQLSVCAICKKDIERKIAMF